MAKVGSRVELPDTPGQWMIASIFDGKAYLIPKTLGAMPHLNLSGVDGKGMVAIPAWEAETLAEADPPGPAAAQPAD
jgi:hypothetical protein